MSRSVSRQGNEGQEKEKPASPDPRKASCAHKGPGSTATRGTVWGRWGGCGKGGERDTIGLHVVRAYKAVYGHKKRTSKNLSVL